MSSEGRSTIIASALLGGLMAIGVAVAGMSIGRAIFEGRRAERYVTVRGLAEREVRADVANWPIPFTVSAAELARAHADGEAAKQKVLAFLKAGGFGDKEIDVGSVRVTDRQAREYGGDQVQGLRFLVAQVVTVHSANVDKVADVSRRVGELVKAGLVLQGSSDVTYHFTGVNGIKPGLLAEATKAARAAAAQFAADSGARVGEIRRATQGALAIVPLEGYGAGGGDEDHAGGAERWIRQKVRVVMTVEFQLER